MKENGISREERARERHARFQQEWNRQDDEEGQKKLARKGAERRAELMYRRILSAPSIGTAIIGLGLLRRREK